MSQCSSLVKPVESRMSEPVKGPRGYLRRYARRAEGPKDPLWLIFRRKKTGRILRSILYGRDVRQGHEPIPWDDQPEASVSSWAFFVGDYAGRGLYKYSELLHIARQWNNDNPFSAPSQYDREVDASRMSHYGGYLRKRAYDEGRYQAASEMLRDGTVYYGRLKGMARQSLLDGLCPWDGGVLPCEPHDIGICYIDGHGGLKHTPPSTLRSRSEQWLRCLADDGPAPDGVIMPSEPTSLPDDADVHPAVQSVLAGLPDPVTGLVYPAARSAVEGLSGAKNHLTPEVPCPESPAPAAVNDDGSLNSTPTTETSSPRSDFVGGVSSTEYVNTSQESADEGRSCEMERPS